MKEIFSTKVFDDGYIQSVHASTVLKIGKDEFLCAFFGGTREGNDDVKIWISRFKDGRWSRPEIIAEGIDEPCWNPVLFQYSEKIMLFYKVGKPIPKWRTMLTESFDNGESWSEPAELVKGDEGGRGPVKNKAIMLSDGRICAPASIETKTTWDCFTDVSSDGGKTWQRSEFVPYDHENNEGKGIIQPTLWEADGRIYMLTRSTASSIMRSESSDGGKTWSPAERTELPNNNSGIDCVKLNDGRIVLIYNPIDGRHGDRNIIGISESADNGRSFTPCMIVEKDDDTDAEFSYPAIICDEKYVYTTYTHYRKNIMFRIFEID